MSTLVLILVLAGIQGVGLASAHEIGISKAKLVELDGHHYELSVQAGPAGASLFWSPLLPNLCKFKVNPRGTQGRRWRHFEFVCDKPLTGSDTLLLPWRRDGAMVTARWLDGSEAKRLFRREAAYIPVPLAELQAGSGSWLEGAKRYISLGIEHILLGIDHLLFVLALLLIVRSPWMLIKTITAFTVAHSITLALATLGLLSVPPRPVEAAIALSIVFLCIEIVHAHQGRVGLTYRSPWLVAFAFGLLHGLGFAGALAEIGLPQSEIPLALLFFNIGVEIGQLLFVGVVLAIGLALAWWLRPRLLHSRSWVRGIPAYAIGTAATYWFIQRVLVMVPNS